MKKCVVLCFLIITISFTSFASIVNYNLTGESLCGDLNGFLSFESVGVPRPGDPGYTSGYVDFKMYNFFLNNPYDVIINSNDDGNKIMFMASHIDNIQTIRYHGDRILIPHIQEAFISFDGLTETPEDGSVLFAPDTFDIYVLAGAQGDNGFFINHGIPSTWPIHATLISSVDEPGTSTFVLYGLALIFLIAIINKRSIVKI